jgi:hypothetical protein
MIAALNGRQAALSVTGRKMMSCIKKEKDP